MIIQKLKALMWGGNKNTNNLKNEKKKTRYNEHSIAWAMKRLGQTKNVSCHIIDDGGCEFMSVHEKVN